MTLIIGTKPLFQFDRSSKTTEAAKKQLEVIAATEANRDADNSIIADVSEVLILVKSDIYYCLLCRTYFKKKTLWLEMLRI